MPFSKKDREQLIGLFKNCQRCGKLLAEDTKVHGINRSHAHVLHGQVLCDECHKDTTDYGRHKHKPGDFQYPLVG